MLKGPKDEIEPGEGDNDWPARNSTGNESSEEAIGYRGKDDAVASQKITLTEAACRAKDQGLKGGPLSMAGSRAYWQMRPQERPLNRETARRKHEEVKDDTNDSEDEAGRTTAAAKGGRTSLLRQTAADQRDAGTAPPPHQKQRPVHPEGRQGTQPESDGPGQMGHVNDMATSGHSKSRRQAAPRRPPKPTPKRASSPQKYRNIHDRQM